MSVIVKGMEMPQKCGQCKLFHAEHPMHCMAVKGYRTVGAPYGMPRPDWCPLVEVKEPHGRLIDADAVNKAMDERIKKLKDDKSIYEASCVSTALDMFAQTVIEAEGSET